MKRDLKLQERKEGIREKRVSQVVKFDLEEIRKHFFESITQINELFLLEKSLDDVKRTSYAEQIWRTQIVFLVSAFDFFMHEIVKFGLNKIYEKEWEKTEKYNNLSICLGMIDEILREENDINWFPDFVNRKFLTETIISYESVVDALKLLGIDNKKIADAVFYERDSDEKTQMKLKRKLNELFARRNWIVHQSDRRHTDAELIKISDVEVREFVYNIQKIVEAIIECAKNK